ncbi:hypothetical protein T4B_10899 [Trichinella pseudospiralis]|uniref:Uncharacterized protein n=1 Tax=Trichinella pseudospiralis TaxID=6337 RepID=A0A0V1H386_TRIPS|nr:hypothetical protein T4B_839 [Trichinella pseudospiralis]KRZ04783.1 hypothetical protein T4B_10899 [Trichinella pseudospiralis]
MYAPTVWLKKLTSLLKAAARYTSFTALPEKRMPWLEQIPHLLHLLETPPPRVFRKAKLNQLWRYAH